MTPEQAQYKVDALLTVHQRAWHSLIARCKTGEPFTHEEGIQLLEVLLQSHDVYRALFRRLVKTSRPMIPVPELLAMAEQVATQLQELVQRLCSESSQFVHVRKPSQQSN
jgi:hypothetical protein